MSGTAAGEEIVSQSDHYPLFGKTFSLRKKMVTRTNHTSSLFHSLNTIHQKTQHH